MNTLRPAQAWWTAVAAVFLLAALGAAGQIAVPLYVGNLVPVLDPYGQPMPGTYDSDPSERARVEIRVATTGTPWPMASITTRGNESRRVGKSRISTRA